MHATSFHKILKPLFATLRKLRHLCFGYIDDTHLQGDTITECVNTIDALFQKVGFIIHPDKSVLQPVEWLAGISRVYIRLIANDCTSYIRESHKRQ